ncbi:hypothetical protein IW262DRAFT_1302966 [Armillaria fumosa]|nr:hypothetical protein IW262DRAFT_1302966 [Armillaria fumosa]
MRDSHVINDLHVSRFGSGYPGLTKTKQGSNQRPKIILRPMQPLYQRISLFCAEPSTAFSVSSTSLKRINKMLMQQRSRRTSTLKRQLYLRRALLATLAQASPPLQFCAGSGGAGSSTLPTSDACGKLTQCTAKTVGMHGCIDVLVHADYHEASDLNSPGSHHVQKIGEDSKIVMHSGNASIKRSRVERRMNPQVLIDPAILASLSTICAIVDPALGRYYYPMGAPCLHGDDRSEDNPSLNGLITWAYGLLTQWERWRRGTKADSYLFSDKTGTDTAGDDIKTETERHLNEYANEGLRTLTLAYKVISNDEYKSSEQYHHASVSMDDCEEKPLEKVSEELERDLRLLGAIEDRLQHDILETIADLNRAGIKMWVATCGKLEIARLYQISDKVCAERLSIMLKNTVQQSRSWSMVHLPGLRR